MIRPLVQFRDNILAIRSLKGTVDHINSITTNALDLSDMYRSQIVLAVSALDHFVHEYVLHGMIEAYLGNRTRTQAFLKFGIPLSVVHVASGTPSEMLIREVVKEKHSWLSFQDPDKIADAIRLISEKKLWEEVSVLMSMQPRDIKARLKLIVDRRNKIAHEADMDPTNPGVKWPIIPQDVDNCLDFISNVVEYIVHVT